jgi:hypothetical membrane protein
MNDRSEPGEDGTSSRSHWPLELGGPIAAILFAASLIGFAAFRTDGYTHGTKAVSELGAIGAPMADWFNIFGFIRPGLLVTLLASSLYRVIAPARAGAILLALSGFAMVVAGAFPIEMDGHSSSSSQLHLLGAMLSGLLWALSLFWTAPQLGKIAGFRMFARLTPWFALFLVVNVGWQIVWQATGAVLPGWGQRIGFGGYFLWAAILGLKLHRRG